MELYQPRNICFEGIREYHGWKMKLYSIVYREENRSELLAQQSRKLPETELPPIGDGNYGLGFLIVHHGKDANFVLLDWWCNENELRHQVYYSTKEQPGQLIRQNSSSPIACVWDLGVIYHERNAWVRHMMKNQPDVTGYLNDFHQ
jgi:hypothetical protein